MKSYRATGTSSKRKDKAPLRPQRSLVLMYCLRFYWSNFNCALRIAHSQIISISSLDGSAFLSAHGLS